MQSSLSAIFDNRRAAEAAIAALLQAGMASSAIHLGVGDPTGADSAITGDGNSMDTIEARGGVATFLHTLFGTDNSEQAQRIDGAVTHSHLVLTVTGDPIALEPAAIELRRHAPVRIDAVAAQRPAPPGHGPLSQLQAAPPGRAATPAHADEHEHEANWRAHHASHAQAGEQYDEYAPAYLYGLDMATHEQHGGKEWKQAEADLRGEWERRHPQSAWHKFGEAVRHGWRRLRGD